jgi:hypothetical protein
MNLQNLVPYLQNPIIYRYPVPCESDRHHPTIISQMFVSVFSTHLDVPCVHFPSVFPLKPRMKLSPLLATCPAHPILLQFIVPAIMNE